MPNHGKYPDELRERAVRMVLDHGHEFGSQWEAICSVADKLGPKPETVRLWVRQAEKDTGRRPGATSEELAELKRLKRENAELRRANDMAGSAGERIGPVTIGVRRSRERCLGRDSHAGAEAARVPSPTSWLAAGGHREGDRLHRAHGRADGPRRPVHDGSARRVGAPSGLSRHF